MKRSTATELATKTTFISVDQILDVALELVRQGGEQATARDLFLVLNHGRSLNLYEKILFVVKEDFIFKHLAITKIGNVYTLTLEKTDGSDISSLRAKIFLQMVEVWEDQKIKEETTHLKATTALKDAVANALRQKGKRANVKDVLMFLEPNLRLGNGRYTFRITRYTIYFNGFLGTIIAEVVDRNGFKKTIRDAAELNQYI